MTQELTRQSDRRMALGRVLRVVVWSHVVVAAVSFFVFLSTLHLRLLLRATTLLIMGAPILLPYIGSAVYCSRLYTWQGDGPSRLRVALFITILVGGAVAIDSALLGQFGQIELLTWFGLLGAQSWAYLWSASWILDVI
jgi:hypothetical protein